MRKNPYKDDYCFQERLTRGGRVVNDLCYVGDYYVLPFDKKEKRKTSFLNIVYILLILLFMVLAGSLNADSSRTAWIVFPYLFTFLPIAYMTMGAITYFGAPIRMQKVQYEKGIERMRRSAIGVIIFSTLNIILDFIYMMTHRDDLHWMREVIYLLSFIAILIVIVFYRQFYNSHYAGFTLEASKNKLEA